MPIHILLKHDGAANKRVQALVRIIIDQINATEHFVVANFSSDGDLGHQALYDKSFEEILEIDAQLDLENILSSKKIRRLTIVAITDLLYAFKVLRIRFLINDILNFGSTLKAFIQRR